MSSTPRVLASKLQASPAISLVDWIQSGETNGGFFDDAKIEIRRMFPHQMDSPMGVFAKQDIAMNETILKIPRHFYLGLTRGTHPSKATTTTTPTEETYNMSDYFSTTCRLAHKLLEEMSKYEAHQPNNSSDYLPYLAYIQSQPKGQIPATYSPVGKEVLRKLSGSNSSTGREEDDTKDDYSLPPWQLVDWIDLHFVQTGCIAKGDDVAYHAVALVIQRGYDHELIPVWDMFNHDNGKLNLETNSLQSLEGLKVWAANDIRAGEELYASYNYCYDCLDVGDDWGTPGIFRDFGFVEDYPQVWPFWNHNFFFEVNRNEETGEIHAEFEVDEETGRLGWVPDEKGLAYLQTEYNRLTKFVVDDEIEQLGAKAKLPLNEYQNIKRYHASLVIALKAGIEAALEVQGSTTSNDEL